MIQFSRSKVPHAKRKIESDEDENVPLLSRKKSKKTANLKTKKKKRKHADDDDSDAEPEETQVIGFSSVIIFFLINLDQNGIFHIVFL